MESAAFGDRCDGEYFLVEPMTVIFTSTSFFWAASSTPGRSRTISD